MPITRRKVLFVARAMPWPLNGGARIRDFNMLQALSGLFDLDLLTVGTHEPRVDTLCANVHLPTPYYGDESLYLALRRWSAAAIESLRGPEPLWLTSKTNGTLRAAIRGLANEGGYSAIHASELSSVSALIGHTRTPIVYDAHNCEWRLLDTMRAKQTGMKRVFLEHEVPRLRNVEKLAVTRSSMVLTTAQSDLDELKDLANGEMAVARVIHSTIDLARYEKVRRAVPETGTILIPGKFDWRPNLIGLEWFASEVVPALRSRMSGTPFRVIVAGRMTNATVRRLNAVPELTAIQNPTDMLEHFARGSVISVPVLVSSGTRLRIAEALACRRPVVSTTAGSTGIKVGDSTPWIVADEADAHADALARVLRDAATAARMSNDGWTLVQQLDWRTLREPLREAYGQVFRSVR